VKIQFLGGAQTVTGSKHLVTYENLHILVDCGMFQGQKDLRQKNWEPFPGDIEKLDAVILTHAHIDHSGFLPLLVKQGYKGPIYATKATYDLCQVLLRDSGRIHEEDARRANRYGYSKHKPALPLYTEEDAIFALQQFKTFDFGADVPLRDDLRFHASHAGHILGSAIITMRNDNTAIVFSGDLGRPNDNVMREPATIQHADYLVLESTYGNRLHPESDPVEELGRVINETVKQGGVVLIPSFAVGRTQHILFLLWRLKQEGKLPDVPIYLDSPMAQDATEIMRAHQNEHKLTEEVAHEVCQMADYIESVDASKELHKGSYPKIILSASGMAEGGRVLHHIKRFGSDPHNSIIFTGFQAPGTRGDKLVRGFREVKIHGKMVPINARVEILESLSSHADYDEILSWLEGFTKPPRKVFLTHGNLESAEALKAKIEENFNWRVVIPEEGQEFNL
jgi:metallo-beta-lactamase family protein